MKVLEAIEKLKSFDSINTSVEFEISVSVIVRPSYVYKSLSKKIDFIQNVEHVICNEFCVTEKELKSSYRGRNISDARSALWLILRDSSLNLSFKEIGKIYNRNHSSILVSVQKFRGLIEVDKNFKHKMDMLNTKIEIIIKTQNE